MDTISIQASYYQQFDADFSLDVPGEGYGGWRTSEIDLSSKHTGFVVMHAWDTGTREAYPGWHRAVEYIPRAQEISRQVFPELLASIRSVDMPLFHVVGGGEYYRDYPGYKRAVSLAGPRPEPPEPLPADPVLDQLKRFRSENVFTGLHNAPDVSRGMGRMDFLHEARPVGGEGIAENGQQLAALCRAEGINHLIYMGFAINWCLLLSPGGMAEMQKYGVMCSTIRQAVTAVENKETAREELCKEVGLWRVALAYGFVFDVKDVTLALQAL